MPAIKFATGTSWGIWNGFKNKPGRQNRRALIGEEELSRKRKRNGEEGGGKWGKGRIHQRAKVITPTAPAVAVPICHAGTVRDQTYKLLPWRKKERKKKADA